MKKLVLFALLNLYSCFSALACSCEYVGLFESMESSDIIFKGKVIDIKYTRDGIEGGDEVLLVNGVTFSVEKVYKDKLGIELTEYAVGIFPLCHIPFELNETYLVYSTVEDFNLYTDACTRTKSFGFIAFIEILFLTKWIYAFPPITIGVVFLIWRFIKKAQSEK